MSQPHRCVACSACLRRRQDQSEMDKQLKARVQAILGESHHCDHSHSSHPCEDGQKPSAIKAKSQGQMGRETPTAKALAAAALSLQQEADKWEDDNNAIVKVAKEMSSQMYHMAGYIRGQGPIKSRDELIDTAKAIAKNGETIVKFAKLLGQYCADKRFVGDLLFHADHIPTLSTQLSIIASVKAATPDDKSAEKMLVQNADNLMEAVIKTMTAAESACAKGMQAPASTADLDETSAVVLAIRWRKKFNRQQQQAKQQVEYDELGLRKVNPLKDSPSLSHIFARR